MSDYRPNFPALMKPAQNAVDKLYTYRENNPLRTSEEFVNFSSPLQSPAAVSSHLSRSSSPSISQGSSRPPTPLPMVEDFDSRAKAMTFDSTRMAIPSSAYAPAYVHASRPLSPFAPPLNRSPSPFPRSVRTLSPSQYAPPGRSSCRFQPGHMPALTPRPSPSPIPPVALTPESIIYELLIERLQGLLRANLPAWWIKNYDALKHISSKPRLRPVISD
jgi:hypothetical protein